jgi:FixJ family two-component response regulator
MVKRNVKQMQKVDNQIFTERETQVIHGILEGLTSKQIAKKLGISHRTVDVHRLTMRKKLEAYFPKPSFKDMMIKLGIITENEEDEVKT